MDYPPPPARPSAPVPPPAAGPPQLSTDGCWFWDGAQWRPVAIPGPPWARPYAALDGPATAAVTFVAIVSGASALAILAAIVALLTLGYSASSAPSLLAGLFELLTTFIYWVGLVGGAIAVPIWIHRAFRNLPALGAAALTWSPVWAAAGWFIPLGNFVIPYLVTFELWRRVHHESEPLGPLVHLWWGLVVGSFALLIVEAALNVFGVAAGGLLVGQVRNVTLIVAGVLLIAIIRQVTTRERARFAQLLAGSA